MRAAYFMEFDFLNTKKYVLFTIPMFFVIAFLLSNSTGFGIVYMLFGGVIFSTQPFALTRRNEIGLIQMLPGSVAHQVQGRFLYGALMQLICSVGAALIQLIQNIQGRGLQADPVVINMLGLTVTLFTVGIQYLLLYALGDSLGIQFMSIVRMVPGFIVFFAGSSLVGIYSDGNMPEVGLLIWSQLMSNQGLLLLVLLLASILIYGLCLLGSVAIEKRRR